MRRGFRLSIGSCLLLTLCAARLPAGGLLPDRANKLQIGGRFSNPQQGFLAIFSAKPLVDESGRPVTSLPEKYLKSFANDANTVLIKLYGKPPTKPGQFEFLFGPGDDAQRPWNDGRDFAWETWEKLSPDIWDNLCLVAPVDPSARNPLAAISDVTLIRGDKLLYDSRKRESYPNKLRVSANFPEFNGAPKREKYPVLNLADRILKFRREFYELGDNPLLLSAYTDVGQTEKRKYARRGTNWCSEFASWVYRENGLMTPDPNVADVHFANMRTFFELQGKVYPLREVASWSDKEKMTRIKPGSFVSILTGDSTHSLIFTTWIRTGSEPITQYTGISGNNKGMVWPHAPLKLPDLSSLAGMSPEQLSEYDAKVYVAVPETR